MWVFVLPLDWVGWSRVGGKDTFEYLCQLDVRVISVHTHTHTPKPMSPVLHFETVSHREVKYFA